MKSTRLNPFQVLRDQWAIMSFYERFEQVVALVLSAVIAVIIVVSLFQLISIVFTLLVLDAFNPLDHKVFQSVFGMIMTLLIAMEFKHSIVRVDQRSFAAAIGLAEQVMSTLGMSTELIEGHISAMRRRLDSSRFPGSSSS